MEKKVNEEKIIKKEKYVSPENRKAKKNELEFKNILPDSNRGISSFFSEENNLSELILENKVEAINLEILKQTDETIFNKQKNKLVISDREKVFIEALPTSLYLLEIKKLDFVRKYQFSKEKTWVFNIGIQGGLNFPMRNLGNFSPEFQPYATLRNETETTKTGFQLGLKTGVKHKSGFTFSTGINFTQIVEQFKFQGSTFKQVFISNGIIAYQININQDTFPVIGDFEYIRETEHNKEYQNYYRLFEIPILIGYQKVAHSWAWEIQGGVSANISLQTIGLIFTPNNDFVNLESEQEDYFKSNIGLSYYIGGVGKYFMNNNLAITFSPHFRFFPKSFTKSQNGITQKYSLAGLNLGFEYQF